jgi:hypothetical protein
MLLRELSGLEPRGNLAAGISAAVLGLIPSKITASDSSRDAVGGSGILRLLQWFSTPAGALSACLISFAAGAGSMLLISELFPPRPLTPISAEDLLKSPPGTGAGAELVFSNSSSNGIELFWLDSSGKEVSYKDLAPGHTRSMSSYSGHPWLVKDASTQESLLLVLPRNQEQGGFSIGVAGKR